MLTFDQLLAVSKSCSNVTSYRANELLLAMMNASAILSVKVEGKQILLIENGESVCLLETDGARKLAEVLVELAAKIEAE